MCSATEASAHCYFTLFRADDVEGPVALVAGPEMVGDYRDTVLLTEAGWRFHTRTATAAFIKARD